MRNILTQNRDVSAFAPISVSKGIIPLCVPIESDESFSDEVGGRYSGRIYSLWRRLNLDYYIESPAEPAVAKSSVKVNNFIQQIFFNSKHSRKYSHSASVNIICYRPFYQIFVHVC